MGVVVDPTGLVVSQASTCEPYALRGVQVGGKKVSATMKAVDSENDLALIQLPPGSYQALPLAPSPPDLGERLALGAGFDYSLAPVDAVSRGQMARGAFLYQGVSPTAARGGPILNDRGEVSGIVLGRLRGFPGHSFNLAADSAAIQRLWKGTPPSSGGRDPVLQNCTRALIRAVPSLTDRQKPTRANSKIEPGQNLGNFVLGMTSAQLEGELGAGDRRELASGVTVLDYPAQVLTFYLVADRTVAIATTYNFYTSRKGLCVGTPVDSRRLGREFDSYLRGPQRRGEHVISDGLELTIDESGKVSRLILVPGA